ncbi:MAG TPA: hypothetical protein VJ779_15295 [Acetobacteraceae bacterium]|nr:hypothetical protein [Acetobacteraceae bacterium]
MTHFIRVTSANIIADAGKVRLGGFAPALAPATADAGKVRLGGFAPALPPVRR